MYYKIIQDEALLKEFIEWLPDLEDNEKFYCCLFARKKYTEQEGIRHDKSQLRRFLSDKARLFDKIRQLEVAYGAYSLKGVEAPQESLVLYINPNPRNLKKATYKGIIKFTELLRSDNTNYNPHAELMSCIQRTLGRKIYLDFDVDTKDFDFEKLQEVINPSCLSILETRGGYHILVKLAEVEKKYQKSFYHSIVSLGVDQQGDQLLPVPGCVQGGFMPRFVEKYT